MPSTPTTNTTSSTTPQTTAATTGFTTPTNTISNVTPNAPRPTRSNRAGAETTPPSSATTTQPSTATNPIQLSDLQNFLQGIAPIAQRGGQQQSGKIFKLFYLY